MGILGRDLRVMEGASVPRGITLQITDDSNIITPQVGPQDMGPLEGSIRLLHLILISQCLTVCVRVSCRGSGVSFRRLFLTS